MARRRKSSTQWYSFVTTIDLDPGRPYGVTFINDERGTVPMFVVQETGGGGISSGTLASDPTVIPDGTLLRTFIKGAVDIQESFELAPASFTHFAHWLFALRLEESFEQGGSFLQKPPPVLFGSDNALGFENFLGFDSRHTWFVRKDLGVPTAMNKLVAPWSIDSKANRILEDNHILSLDINNIYQGMRTDPALEIPPKVTFDCRILIKHS